ncbi:hypothetical protein [Paenarthrobacter ilicis]|uniref:hypothetical protein n=1 Tax=Paenarthrobacter ilicis TaxID=43665 RepID=UPI0028D8F073|nr:hypothetical protein [Paenarthrobacter ilicis]
MKKWLQRALITVVIIAALGFVDSLLWPGSAAIWAGVWAWVTRPTELGRFGWEALTGPPAAGALAVIAALIAYTGIRNQVAEAKRDNDITVTANEETARKNDVDQWWSTLKWAYTEAKTFEEQDKPESRGLFAKIRQLSRHDRLSEIQKTKESQAIITILRSLARHKGPQNEKLSALQKTTVAEVLGMFGDSPNEGVQNQLDEALIDLGRTSDPGDSFLPSVRGQAAAALRYEEGLLAALKDIDPKIGELTDDQPYEQVARHRRYDGVVRTTGQHLIAIEAKYRSGRQPLDRRQLASILAYLPEPGEGGRYRESDLVSAGGVDRILIVANTSLTDSARGMLERRSSTVGYVTWNLGDPADDIHRELKRLAREN